MPALGPGEIAFITFAIIGLAWLAAWRLGREQKRPPLAKYDAHGDYPHLPTEFPRFFHARPFSSEVQQDHDA